MPTGRRTLTDRARLRCRAERVLAVERLSAPATRANLARNARAERGRHARWAPARDALWTLVDVHVPAGARVAIAGAGNGDDLPLARIAGRAAEVALIDLDPRATRAARRRLPRRLRGRVELIACDVSDGEADAIAVAAARGRFPDPVGIAPAPLPGAPYDLVIGDLLYSQLLYPALVDLGLPAATLPAVVERWAPLLTRRVVARLHASAPGGAVVHIHDPIAWWPGHPQPVTLEQILSAAALDPASALALAGQGTGPRHSDPRAALNGLAIPIRATALWHWPFAAGVDYLACATLAGPTADQGTTGVTMTA